MLSVCPHDCPSCCSLVVTVEDGRLTSVTGNPEHPFTRGIICGKVREYAERVHSPLRVLTPLRRVGRKGAGDFAAISWDEAVATIADRWRRIIATDGAEAILPFSYAGSMGQVQYTRATRSSTRSAPAGSTARSASRPHTRAGGRPSAPSPATTPSRWSAPTWSCSGA